MKPLGVRPTTPDRHMATLLVAFAVATMALLPRFHFPIVAADYLWGEDGSIFINQAHALGLGALLVPYAGYLHIYPRLVAWLAAPLSLPSQANVFLAAWLLAYFIMVAAIVDWGRSHRIAPIGIASVVALVALQPHYTEVFFTVTNAQWLFGAALMFLLNTRYDAPPRLRRLALLAVLSLTGPFSILAIPVMAVEAAANGTFRRRLAMNGVILAGAVIQLVVVLRSERIAGTDMVTDPITWIKVTARVLAFGAYNWPTSVCALLAWVLLLFALSTRTGPGTATWPRPDYLRSAWLLLFAAAVNTAASLYAWKASPFHATAVGGGSRYTWIPYSLIFAASIAATEGLPLLRIALLAPLALLCVAMWHALAPPNQQFASYANFARYRDVLIPLNPLIPTFPGWNIAAGPPPSARSTGVIAHDLSLAQITDPDGQPKFEATIACRQARDVGIEFTLERNADGWLRLDWTTRGAFIPEASLRRWYPAGRITAQFAFPAQEDDVQVRLAPVDKAARIDIRRATALCLP